MPPAIDFSRLTEAFAQPRGWLELAVIGLCLAIAWYADQRAWAARERMQDARKLTGGLARVVFPVTALVLLVVARAAFHREGSTFFLDLALPLLVAFAAIRIFMYGLRQFFAEAAWLKTSERTFAIIIWALVALHFLGVLPGFAAELDAFVIPVGRTGISLLTILKGVSAVILTLVVTLWISGFIEQRLMAAHFDVNLRVVLSKMIRAALLVVGVLVALDAIGFDLTLLTVFGGALGVGIGLGLQKLAANYIAGFTILLDRSVRMNDLVTVGDRTGFIARMTSRYVVLRNLDGVDAIVPNESMVTSVVLNHSHSSPDIRMALPLQVSFDSDVERALALMEEAARAEPRVLGAPNPPTAQLSGFGDNGFNVELAVWIRDPENGQGNLRSALNRSIWKSFVAHGIKLPYPQREVRLLGEGPEAGQPPAGGRPAGAPQGARPG